MSRPERDVLIVGAGPTGLTLANCLDAYRVPFTLIERRKERSNDSKALAINVASQQLFALLGRPRTIGQQGQALRRLEVRYDDRRVCRVDFDRLGLHSARLITQPQATTERELYEALPRGSVQWGSELVSLQEENGSVTATIRDAHGREEQTKFAYVVGCDGKGSVVRESMQVGFDGHDYPMHFVLGDFELTWDKAPDTGYYFVYEDTFFVVAPVETGKWRVVVKHMGADVPNRPPTLDDIVLPVEARLGRGLFKGPCSWLSRAPFYMRTARSLRRGRRFIAGDAAHLYSPIGGAGMNTGMQDAFNLAWKLALATRHGEKEDLLASYEDERLEAIKGTALATDRSTRLIARVARDLGDFAHLLPRMQNRSVFRDSLPAQHSGLGARYTRSAIIDGGSDHPLAAGAIFADAPTLLAELAALSARLPEPLATHVLLFTARGALPDHAPLIAELQSVARAQRSHPVRVHVVVLDAERNSDPATLGARDLRLKSRKHLERCVLVLRPDGVIAWRGESSDRVGVVRFVQTLYERQR